MKPPFAYYGGKTGLSERIISLLPPHRVYIEPFFGSGAVFFAKSQVPCEIVNDLDGGIVAFFRALRDRPEDLKRARRFWVRVNQSFGKTGGRQTGFSVTTARSQSTGGSVQGRIDRFHACARRLQRVTIEQCDATRLVERMGTAETLVYCDPPYLASTRRGRDRQRPADYLHDMGSEAEHRRLAEVLHKTPAAVILSGYPSALYEELYGDWWRMDIPVLVHASNSVTAERGERTEVLWANRELDTGLFAGVAYDVADGGGSESQVAPGQRVSDGTADPSTDSRAASPRGADNRRRRED